MLIKGCFIRTASALLQAWYRFIQHVQGKGLLQGIAKIAYYAPEITEYRVEGIFEFNPAPFVTRETLVPLLDKVRSSCCCV